MPIRNVTLTEDLDSFVAMRIESGRYEDVSEVIHAALRSLERDERRDEFRTANLRAIDHGDASGDAADGVFERVRLSLGIR